MQFLLTSWACKIDNLPAQSKSYLPLACGRVLHTVLSGGHSNINSLCMLYDKNGVKGSDFEHTMATPFFQIRGPYLASLQHLGSLFEPTGQFFKKKKKKKRFSWPLIISISIFIFQYRHENFQEKSRNSCFFGQNLCIFLPFHDVLGLFDQISCFFVKSHFHAYM